MHSAVQSQRNVFLFVPNIIGYVRIILALFSFYHMQENPVIASLAYVTSALLDAVDGHAARLLNQCSQFGAILDQLTDRCTFLGLLFALCHLYPNHVFLFQIIGVSDIACHWIHLHASILQNKLSHKADNKNPVLKVYYQNKLVLFLLCTGNEAFFSLLYLFKFFPGKFIIWALWITAPIAVIKTLINFIQGFVACQAIVALDKKTS